LMMLNIKISQLKREKLNYTALVVIFSVVLICNLIVVIRLDFNPILNVSGESLRFLSDLTLSSSSFSNDLNIMVQFNNMISIGHILFVEFALYFIITGYILLLAMVAAITSTLNKKFIAKSQVIHAQVLRSFNNSITRF